MISAARHAFLSYSHDDRAVVERLRDDLLARGEAVWWDADIPAGADWELEIERALRQSYAVVLCWSNAAAARDQGGVFPEIANIIGRYRQFAPGRVFLFPVRLDDCELPEFAIDATRRIDSIQHVDLFPESVWDAGVDQLVAGIRRAPGHPSRAANTDQIAGRSSPSPGAANRSVGRAGLSRYVLDRLCPRTHGFLTRIGTLPTPPELNALRGYLDELHARIANDIRHKTYIPIAARDVPLAPGLEAAGDPYVQPIHQVIRQVLGSAHGGDAASAQIAAVNRRSRAVHNVLRAIVATEDPLVLLGDPGTGKTMTLQQTAMALAVKERIRVFPTVVLYVRLGEFFVPDRTPGAEDVAAYVRRVTPPRVRSYVDALDHAGRLVILFDGMDEMSRHRYSEHTEALSVFAGSRRERTKTLFSCRITDFSPKFVHQRLVLMPFDRAQIGEYLRKYIGQFPITIDERGYSVRQLSDRILSDDLPIDAQNPFVLWLLCSHVQRTHAFPSSRVSLMRSHLVETFRRTTDNAGDEAMEAAFAEWEEIAFAITRLNEGSSVPLSAIATLINRDAAAMQAALRVGKRCGVLVESDEEGVPTVRFDHHRLQEYFSAAYIHRFHPHLSWLDKMDAPRWQETIVNLLLMGGGADALEALTRELASTLDGIEAFRERTRKASGAAEADRERTKKGSARDEDERPALDPGVELVHADRVELTSRVLRHAAPGSDFAQTLRPLFERSVTALSELGNPITQVKMIRACQNVPWLDTVALLEPALHSRIGWVRNQALVLLAGRASRGVGSDVATELVLDVANGVMLRRVPAHIRAARQARSREYWIGLSCATAAAVLNLALLGLMSWGIYWSAERMFAGSEIHVLPTTWAPWVYVAFVAIAAATAFMRDPPHVWIAILGTSAGVPTLWLIVTMLLRGTGSDVLSMLVGLILTVAFGGAIFAAASALAAGASQSLCVLVCLGLTTGMRRSGRSTGLFTTAWRNGSFGDVAEVGLPVVGMMVLGLVFTLAVFAIQKMFGWIAADARQIGTWIEQQLHLPFGPWYSLFVGAMAAVAVLGLPIAAMRKAARVFLASIGLVTSFVSLMVVIGYAIEHWVKPFGRWLLSLVPAVIGRWVGLAVVLVVVVATLAGLGWCGYVLSGVLARAIRQRYTLAPRSVDPVVWRRAFDAARPEQQDVMLRIISHQALGLTPQQFLALLVDLAPSVKRGDVEGTYWSLRDQLEQVLRQERTG